MRADQDRECVCVCFDQKFSYKTCWTFEWAGQEYEMMERDRGKYLLYMAAIEAAIEDLVAQKSMLGDLVVLVLGGGYGRLAEFCRASLLKHRCHCRLIVLEANPEACQVLESRFRSSTEAGSSVKISILDPTTLLPSNSHAVATKNGIHKACMCTTMMKKKNISSQWLDR